ncbi:hypothetical protein MTO96_038703 [Rhipicephalus appendiculatus]
MARRNNFATLDDTRDRVLNMSQNSAQRQGDMASITKRAFARNFTFLLILVHVRGEGEHHSDTSVVDAFKIFRTLPRGTAIFDVDGDGDLDCVTAVRTEFSEDPLETTFVLQFKGLGGNRPQNISFHIKPGRTPDATRFTVGDDYDFVQDAHFYYTNYKNCAVMEQPFRDVHGENNRACRVALS